MNVTPIQRCWFWCLLAVAMFAADTCCATQHLVRAGSNWQMLDKRLKPGDEIILMPGQHRPVTLEAAQGTAERPIIIKGLNPEDLPVIEAERYGIRLINPRHVRIMNLKITGATISGLSVEGPKEAPEDGTEPPGRILITNVTVTDTGPRGLRHAMNLQYLDRANIRDCLIEGWGGSGVEIVASSEVTIERCRFTGKEDFTQINGVRIRAGSQQVRIEGCRFTNAGEQGVCIGGASEMDEFTTPPPEEAAPGSCHEAARVQVLESVFSGGRCAIAFVGCKSATVHRCTISRPTRAVVSIRRDQEDPRFGTAAGCVFSSNLITWQPGDIQTLTHMGEDAHLEGINLEDNLWWTSDWAESREKLGPFPGTVILDQITDVDPKLDDQMKPATDRARQYGIPVL